MIFLKCIPFEEGGVKHVCIVNEFLVIFQGNLRSGGEMLQVLKEAIKAVGA
jgi:hypothetical protein